MIDTHSHLYSTEFHEDLADVVARSKAVGWIKFIFLRLIPPPMKP